MTPHSLVPTVLGEVARVGAGKPIYLLTTHVHPEPDMGAHAFPALRKSGRTREEAVQVIPDEMSAHYPDRNRLAGAVRAAYDN